MCIDDSVCVMAKLNLWIKVHTFKEFMLYDRISFVTGTPWAIYLLSRRMDPGDTELLSKDALNGIFSKK